MSLSVLFPPSNNKCYSTVGWLKDRVQVVENYQILYTQSFTFFLRTPSERSQQSLFPILLCYVMWNLCTVGRLQFCNDSTITSLKTNSNFVFMLKHQHCISRVWDEVWKFFVLIWNTEFLKNIYRNGYKTPVTSETLLPVTLVKRLKAIRKSPGDLNSDVARLDNGPLIT